MKEIGRDWASQLDLYVETSFYLFADVTLFSLSVFLYFCRSISVTSVLSGDNFLYRNFYWHPFTKQRLSVQNCFLSSNKAKLTFHCIHSPTAMHSFEIAECCVHSYTIKMIHAKRFTNVHSHKTIEIHDEQRTRLRFSHETVFSSNIEEREKTWLDTALSPSRTHKHIYAYIFTSACLNVLWLKLLLFLLHFIRTYTHNHSCNLNSMIVCVFVCSIECRLCTHSLRMYLKMWWRRRPEFNLCVWLAPASVYVCVACEWRSIGE